MSHFRRDSHRRIRMVLQEHWPHVAFTNTAKVLVMTLLFTTVQSYPTSCTDRGEFFHEGLCCGLCPKGYRVARYCTEDTPTECEVCPEGYFNHQPSSYSYCRRLEPCDKNHEYIHRAAPPDRTADNECRCQKGYHYTMTGELCLPNIRRPSGKDVTPELGNDPTLMPGQSTLPTQYFESNGNGELDDGTLYIDYNYRREITAGAIACVILVCLLAVITVVYYKSWLCWKVDKKKTDSLDGKKGPTPVML